MTAAEYIRLRDALSRFDGRVAAVTSGLCDHRPRCTDPTGATGGFLAEVHSGLRARARAAALAPIASSSGLQAQKRTARSQGSHRKSRRPGGAGCEPFLRAPLKFGSCELSQLRIRA